MFITLLVQLSKLSDKAHAPIGIGVKNNYMGI